MITPARERNIVLAMLAGYLLLTLAFSFGPIFEGPDEIEHYRFIRTFAQTFTLPDARAQYRGQYHQAPLYYMALLPVAWILRDTDADFAAIDGHLNPYYGDNIGIPGNDNKNLYLHTQAEVFPFGTSTTAQSVHALRLVSILLGLGTILTANRIFNLVWPDRADRRLLALGFVAFMPQFLYLSSTINNDNLLYLLATLTLWLVLRQLREGPSRRLAIQIGVVVGAALLTKVNGAVLLGPVAVVFLLDRRSWRFIPVAAGLAILIAGWWYLRNIAMYNDLTGVRTLLQTWRTEAIRDGAIALDVGLTRLPYSYETFWARFGQGAVPVGLPIYVFFDLMTIMSIIGTIVKIGQTLRRKSANQDANLKIGLVVAVFALGWLGSLVYYASTAWSGNQGRYLLPALAAWGLMIAFGLDAFTPRKLRLPVALSGASLFAGVTAVCVFGYFLPAYQVSAAPAQIEQRLNYRFGDVAELTGVSPATIKAGPGDTVQVTLYWRALKPSAMPLYVYLHSVGSNLVKRDSVPGTGNLQSTDWRPSQTWAEYYIITIPPGTEPQQAYPLIAGLYDPQAAVSGTLPAVNQSGTSVTPVVGRIAIHGGVGSGRIAYKFGDVIGLASPTIDRTGNQIKVCLPWISLKSTPVDYQIFVHFLAGAAPPLTQVDRQPRDGQYPTGAWTPGEQIDDCVSLDAKTIPPDGWRIEIGLYTLSDMKRLPAFTADGHPLPGDSVLIP